MNSLDALFGEIEAPDATAWPLPVSHLSATQITMYQRCPEQWRRRYVLGEKERPGAALIWGSADHYAHEVNFQQKIDSHSDLPVDDIRLAFAEGFDAAIERNGGEGEVEWGSDQPGAIKDAGVELAAHYHRIVSPSIQPTAVESEFSLTVPGVPVPVIGRVDVETAGLAIERKTAKRTSTKVEPKWRIQGLIYQLAAPRSVDWHVSVKKKVPEIATPAQHEGLTLPYIAPMARVTEDLIRATARSILSAHEHFGPDEPWSGALSHEWACGFCGFKKNCHWWGNS